MSGVYDTDAEVAILNRSRGGAPGAWVLTPLVQDDGTAVPIVRGWISYDPSGTQVDFPEAAPPEGEVTVTGVLQLTQVRGSLGPVDAADGTLEALARVDLVRFGEQLDEPLAPAWVMLDGAGAASARRRAGHRGAVRRRVLAELRVHGAVVDLRPDRPRSVTR